MLNRLLAALARWGVLGPRPLEGAATGSDPLASIVLITYNRLAMLQRCLTSMLANTSGVSHEIIVWDNASTDGTSAYLDDLAASDPRLQVIHSDTNVGLNGVARSVARAKGAYIVEMDDDILAFPEGWLQEMIRAFRKVPRAGYLAADVVQDEITNGAKLDARHYQPLDYGDGVIIEHGPAGGWCTITSRSVLDRIGNFIEMPDRIFFSEDGDFANRCLRHRLRVGIIRSVRVYHATGPAANAAYGCLDVCELKYADDPEYQGMLELTRVERSRHADRP